METEKSFSISAKTCTLKFNSQEKGETILGNNRKYVIPIYQRPYSWDGQQIRKFLVDIFISYWGIDSNEDKQPMFIGTMQLSNRDNKNEQQIIDGQQRLTTFLILLKVLKNKFPQAQQLNEIAFDWLSTRVNSGRQQSFLEEIIYGDLTFNSETQNPYLRNAFIINEIIDEQIIDEQNNLIDFNVDDFLKHLLSNIYFVVIETKAGLSKTLQIFNAINTTGLDLNGGDIFKLRMFEYLQSKKGKDESAFDEISSLYKKIDDYNLFLKYKATDITRILNIYQFILIAKYKLPVTLYSYGTDTFFERLFDTILGNEQWEHFKNNVKNIDLSIEDIDKIVEARFEWENNSYQTAEDACAMHFLWWSRYSRYEILIYIFLYKFKDENDAWTKAMQFTRQLSKLYIIYSIRYWKAINEIHSFTYSLINDILLNSFDEVMRAINIKIEQVGRNKKWYVIDVLNGDIVQNAKIKNIVCRLSAMLYEDYKTSDKVEADKIVNLLFASSIDIEHIQSYHDKDGNKREDIWAEWKENINSIGNLMVLEENINRSISNNPYGFKLKVYPSSFFSVVKQQEISYSYWNLEKCLERKRIETEKIVDYLFN